VPSRPSPTNRDLISVREADALAAISELLERLEAATDRVRLAGDAYEAEIRARDAAIWEAWRAGVSQEGIGAICGIAQPHVHRAKERHKARKVKEARAKKAQGEGAAVELEAHE
jgi:hypothetical protein